MYYTLLTSLQHMHEGIDEISNGSLLIEYWNEDDVD